MKITEQDIFNFVFYPEILDKDKRAAIESDSRLKSHIDFYTSIKSSMNQEVPERIKKKIHDKISEYSSKKRITLWYSNDSFDSDDVTLKLAAKSFDSDESPKISNFIDSERKALIKVQHFTTSTKLFLLSNESETLQNINLTIYPQKQSYFLTTSENPLIIDEEITDIESIELEY